MKIIQLLTIFLVVGSVQAQKAKPSASTGSKAGTYITNLMAKMTLEEKIGQLNLLTPGGGILTGSVVSSGVEAQIKAGSVGGLFGVIGVDKIKQAQQLAMNTSRLKIPMIFGSDVIHGYKTTFPIPLGMSCSWDMAMIERSARIAAVEASSDGLSWVFSPMVDIARDPRWGRVAEGSGEDTYLGSQISKAMVKGYQGNDFSSANTVMACVKHFALYGAAEAGRDYNTVDMSRIKMYEYYLPPYKAAVDAGVGSVMTSFNDIDGIPATGNKWLLTDLLRKQWGFKGFVVTDYTAINEMIDHGLGDLQAVSTLALKAGTDMDMVGEGFLKYMKKSLQEGKITQKNIDDACRRILEAKYKLGLFDDPYKYTDNARAAKEVLSSDARQAAREFGTHASVLLKNNNQTLPLKKSGTIALIGPLANDKNNMLGTWAVSGDNQTSTTVLEGMKNVAGPGVNVFYAKGANLSNDTLLAKHVNVFGERINIDGRVPEDLLNEALEVASRADVIVAVVGEASEMTGEAASRSDITIPESQQRLIQALAKTGKPLVLVIMAGRPLVLNMESKLATSIVYAWFQGHEAGNAIADVLFGNYNPSGKLTMTFPQNVGQIPIYYNHKSTGRPQVDGQPTQKFRSNYLDVSNEPLYPFGYGLSYTTFAYGDVNVSKKTMAAADKQTVTIQVSNTGKYDGEEVVQLYIRDMVASVTQPVKKLKAFQKIFLKAGESRQVSFTLSKDDLSFVGTDLTTIYEPGAFKVMIGGNSKDVKEASFMLTK